MIYLLDSNAWIVLMRGKNALLSQRVHSTNPADICLCSVVLGELFYGARHSPPIHQAANLALINQLRQQFASLPFDDRAAEEYGIIRQDLASRGLMIGPNDLLIAAIALANNLTVVTNNTAEFNRVTGLRVEDWQV